MTKKEQFRKDAGIILAHEAHRMKQVPKKNQCDCTIKQAAIALLRLAERQLDQRLTCTGMENIEALEAMREALKGEK